jgi:hypothetical protein
MEEGAAVALSVVASGSRVPKKTSETLCLRAHSCLSTRRRKTLTQEYFCAHSTPDRCGSTVSSRRHNLLLILVRSRHEQRLATMDAVRDMLIYPISLDLIEDPIVVTCCGKAFGRATLAEWLELRSRHHQVCPLCRG